MQQLQNNMTRTVVVLADSYKHGEHCIAGKCVQTGQWIRPVSTPKGGQISDRQARSRNPYGIYPVKALQKVRMSFVEAAPLVNQPENFLIDNSEWQQNYTFSPNQLHTLLDQPESLWGEGDRVCFERIRSQNISIEQSLYLVKVSALTLYINQNNRMRASFSYNGLNYDLAVTCRNSKDIYLNQNSLMGVLCISLGEPWKQDNCCYKLAAAIY